MAAEDFGGYTGNPAGFIRALISEGESATSGLAVFRENGGAINDARWYQMYGQINASIAAEPDMLAVDPFNIPSPADYGEWATRTPGLYATQVEMQILDRDLGEWLTLPYTYVTDEPHTPAEAEQAAMDDFDPSNTGSDFNQAIMGAVAVHLWRTTPLEG